MRHPSPAVSQARPADGRRARDHAPLIEPVLTEPVLTVRAMTGDDLDAVHRLDLAASAQPWPRESLAAELARDDRAYVVATSAGPGGSADEVLGFAGALVAVDEAQVMIVAVDPQVRRRGIGSAVVTTLAATVAARGAEAITLEVREGNTGAQSLYRGLGFVSAGVRPGYYRDTGEGAVIMWLRAPAPPTGA